MRKIVISLAVFSLSTAGFMMACSSSDDSSTPGGTDSGSDTSTADTYVPPTDSGTQDTDADAGPCRTCSEAIEFGPINVCSTNGPPSSSDLVQDIFNCACVTDGGACAGPCVSTCTTLNTASNDCITCVQDQCTSDFAACLADGNDAGPVDASDDGG